MDILNTKILLVEDDVFVAMLEKQQLEDIGYLVHHVKSGEDAVRQACNKDSYYDLILMDIDLGLGIDGTQAAVQILEQRDIPIVFLSAHTEPEIVQKTEKVTSYGYMVKNTDIVVLDTSIKMALKLHHAHKAITESEKRYYDLFDSMTEMFQILELVYDDNGQAIDSYYRDVNAATEKLTGKSRDEMLGKRARELFAIVEDYWIQLMDQVNKSGKTQHIENYSKELDKYFDLTIFKVSNRNNTVAVVFSDITDGKRAEKALQESNELFMQLFNFAPVGISLSTLQEGRYLDVNNECVKIYGATREEMIGKTAMESGVWMDPEARARFTAILQDEGKVRNLEVVLNTRRNKNIPMLVSAEMIVINGEPCMLTSAQDITERKLTEEEIKKQLSEKEILLIDVHHRVKNNIASIENSLTLQARSDNNPEVKIKLQEAVSRIKSMRVLYDNLLISKDYQKVSMKHYIQSLVSSIQSAFPESEKVSIETKISDFSLPTKQANSVGIIINELLTNTFKYAFRGREGGKVFISLEKNDNDMNLTVYDNGIGVDENIQLKKSLGFGLKIVRMFAEQLNGTYSISNENGTKVEVQFKI